MSPERPDIFSRLIQADSCLVKVAADFLRHNPEKLESVLEKAFNAGYQAGLWASVESIRSLPGWQEDE